MSDWLRRAREATGGGEPDTEPASDSSWLDRARQAASSPIPRVAAPRDVAAKITNDPEWRKLMEIQQRYREALTSQRDPAGMAESAAARIGDELENQISSLASRYDVDRNFVMSLARGGDIPETPIATSTSGGESTGNWLQGFLDFRARNVEQSREMLPDVLEGGADAYTDWRQRNVEQSRIHAAPLRKIGGNALGAVEGVLEPLESVGDVNRTGLAKSNERLTGERPGWAEGRDEGGLRLGNFNLGAEVWEAGQVIGAYGETLDEFTREGQWITYAPDFRWGDRVYALSNAQGHSTPYETGVAATGTELLERFGYDEGAKDFVMRWAGPLGLPEEHALAVAGVAAEFITDPLLFADGAFVGARLLRMGGALKTTAGTKAVTLLERMGEDVMKATTPSGLMKTARQNLGVVDRAARSVNKSISNLLDSPIPGVFSPGRAEVGMARVFGVGEKDVGPLLRDALFQRGRAPTDDNFLHWLYGGTTEVSPTSHQTMRPGAVDRAAGIERGIARRTAIGIKNVDDAIVSRLGTQRTRVMQGQKVVIPNSYEMPEEAIRLRSVIHENTWDLLDNYGAADTVKGIQETLPRVRKAADLYGIDPDLAATAFKEATLAARATILDVGYMGSRYGEFVNLIDDTAAKLGYDPARMRVIMESEYAGMDLAEYRRTGEIPDNPFNARPTDAELEQFREFETALQGRMGAEGFDPTLKPSSFLKGVREGYARRVIGARTDPDVMWKQLVDNRSLVVVEHKALPDVAVNMGIEYGDEVGEAVQQYLESRPAHGLVSSEEISRLVSERVGRDVTPPEIAAIVYGGENNPNGRLLEETMQMLRKQGGETGATESAAVYARTRSLAARQDFDEDELTQLLQVYDVPVAMAQMARAVGRNARADELLSSAQKFLGENNLILSPEDIVKEATQVIGAGRKMDEAENVFQFTRRNGDRYVAIPHNAKAWGALAGTAIPYRIGREVVKTVALPSHIRRLRWEPLLNNLRKWQLSPLPTSVVNLLGQFNFGRYGGADFFDTLGNVPRAAMARDTFYETGKLPGLEGAENMLSFFDEGTLSRNVGAGRRTALARHDVYEVLDDLSRATTMSGLDKRMARAMETLNGLNDKLTTDPRYGGFLGMFAWGEETSRIASAYQLRDQLMRRGVPRQEAIYRGAHFANNIGGDYGALPGIPAALRRTGLSMFPQFAWFNAGRTARAMVERPGAYQRLEYARQGVNTAVVGDHEDQEQVTAMAEGWQRPEQPLVLNLPGREPGRYAVANLSRINPLGFDAETLIMGPAMLDVYLPMLEAIVSLSQNRGTPQEGSAFYSQRYGERVYEPGENPALGVAKFLGRNYFLPGHQRMLNNIAETANYYQFKDEIDAQNRMVGKHQNREVAQLVLRFLGFSTFDVDVNGTSFRRRFNEIARSEKPVKPDIMGERRRVGGDAAAKLREYTAGHRDMARMLQELAKYR